MSHEALIEDARKWAADSALIPHERAMWQDRVRSLIDEQRAIEDREAARQEDAEFNACDNATNWEAL
jgi:hypothetical protein